MRSIGTICLGFLRETRTINITMYDHVMGHCLCYPWEYLSLYFTAKSAIQIHLSFFYSYFCNVKQNKVSYKIGQFLKIKCAIPRSAYNGLPEREQKQKLK